MGKNFSPLCHDRFHRTGVLRWVVVYFFLTLLPAGRDIFAQPVMTLEEAMALALQYNYDILLSKNDSSVAALDYSYRNAVFLPRLNATVGTAWTENAQKQKFTSGTDKTGNVSTNNISAAINLNWTLFDGWKMFATRDKAREYIRLGELRIKEQIINTLAEVIITYYDVVRQKQQLKAIEEQMRLSQARLDLAQRKLEIGAGAKPDVLQSQVDLNAQRAARLQQETRIEQARESLDQLIRPARNGAPGGLSTLYEVVDTIPLEPPQELEDILSQLDQNPSVQITQKNIDLAYLSLKEKRADRWPVVQFNSAYNFSRVNNDIALNPALPLFNRNSGFNYGFSATIPILNYRNTQRLIRQEELNIGFQRLYLTNQRSLLQLSMLQAYKEYVFQKQALALEEENIVLARENVNILLESYRLGQITTVQLREAQKSLADASDRLIAARYAAKAAETELRRQQGKLIRQR